MCIDWWQQGCRQASGLPVHITCVNSYLTALIKEVRIEAVRLYAKS
jgi:hypothetical protein